MGDALSVFWWFDDGTDERYCRVECDDGDFDGACDVRDQLFHDEYGVKPEYSCGDVMFDVVAVPDDVALDFPAPADVAILAGERAASREALAELARVCDGTVFEYPDPRRVR